MVLHGKICSLRSVGSQDIDTILLWENDPQVRRAGTPEKERFTRADIEQFVRNQSHPLSETEQQRLMIEVGGRTVGAIDLYDYDGTSAGVGILVYAPADRQKGYAADALRTLIAYARSLRLALLRADVAPDNTPSLRLFARARFVRATESADKIGFIYIL